MVGLSTNLQKEFWNHILVYVIYIFLADVPVRLVDGEKVKSNETHGLVEVFHNREWRSVCDDYWTDKEANVVCGQLKFLSYGKLYSRIDLICHCETLGFWSTQSQHVKPMAE